MTGNLLLDLVWKGQLYWNEMVYTISLVGARPAKDPIGRNEWKVWQVNENHKVHTRNCDMLLGIKPKPMSHTGFNHLMTEAYQQRHAYVHAKQPRSLMHETEFLHRHARTRRGATLERQHRIFGAQEDLSPDVQLKPSAHDGWGVTVGT